MAKDFLTDEEMAALSGDTGVISDEQMAQLEAQHTAPTPKSDGGGAGMAALEGFGQTATLGYLPQLQAMAEKPMAKVMDFFTGNNVAEQMPDYVQRRDENIQRQAQQASAHPMASMAGKAAGIGATLLAPGAAAAKGAGAAAKIGRGAAMGAAQGAAYNPGDQEGVVDPVQVSERTQNALLGGLTGGALSSVGAAAAPLARKHRMIDQVKHPASLAKHVKGEIDTALSGVGQNYIKPRANELKELLQNKSVELNPDRIKGVSPGIDRLASMLDKRTNAEGRAQMSAPRAQRLKRALDAHADYAASKPHSDVSHATSETAAAGANIVRRNLEKLHPKVETLNSEMRQAMNLRDALKKQSQSTPIAAVRGTNLDKEGLLDAIDDMGGSNLSGLGSDIDAAKNLLFKPANLAKPMEAANEFRKLGVRGAGRAARAAEGVDSPGALQAALQALFETKR